MKGRVIPVIVQRSDIEDRPITVALVIPKSYKVQNLNILDSSSVSGSCKMAIYIQLSLLRKLSFKKENYCKARIRAELFEF